MSKLLLPANSVVLKVLDKPTLTKVSGHTIDAIKDILCDNEDFIERLKEHEAKLTEAIGALTLYSNLAVMKHVKTYGIKKVGVTTSEAKSINRDIMNEIKLIDDTTLSTIYNKLNDVGYKPSKSKVFNEQQQKVGYFVNTIVLKYCEQNQRTVNNTTFSRQRSKQIKRLIKDIVEHIDDWINVIDAYDFNPYTIDI